MRRALLVGIDNYPGSPLRGCINDARAVQALLSRHSDASPNFDCVLLTSDLATITRASLTKVLTELFAGESDVVLFFFAGHGTANNLDGFLVTPDAAQYDEGVGLTRVLALANESRAKEVVIILDACQSGAMGNVPAIGSNLANIREGISILTASRSSEGAAEFDGHGLFTSLVVGALDGGAADVLGKITAAAIYAYVDESLGAWEQRPLFKSHVARLISLRNAEPAVPRETLRRLLDWFGKQDDVLALDPSYEPTADPPDSDHENVFAQLQRCRAAKLVEPVDEEHLYFAAMNSTGCRLTPLGQHYWRQARDNRI